MTFSLIGRCEQTGAFGAAITTSGLAVGSRCIALAHGKGAVLSQHRTDSRLAQLGIALLREGLSAAETVSQICASTSDIDWRQVGALDVKGRAAVYHGRRMYSIYTHSLAKNCLALGNILDNEKVTEQMALAFQAEPDRPLADRLMQALEAGEAAGGEVLGPLRSAALQVTGDHGIATCDLRIDLSKGSAVADLRALYEAYRQHGATIRRVALSPDTVPVNRNLFEASIQRIEALGLTKRFPTDENRQSWTLQD